MKSDQLEKSRQSGKNVWFAIQNQIAEGGGFISAMFGSFRDFVKKYFVSFVLFGVLGGAVAAGIWFLKPKVYEAEMTVSYVHYEKKIYADMLEKLDRLIESKSYTSLAEILDLPVETVEKLKSIKGYNIRKEDLTGDLSTEKIPFYISAKVTDIDVLDALQPAIVNYLDGSEFIQNRLNYMKQKSEDELKFLEQRLEIVDSLSRFLILQEDKMLSEKTVSRMELLEETLAIYSKIQEVKGSLTFNQNIEVLDGFIANDKPSGKSVTFWILYGFLAGIGLRFLVLIFK